MPRMLCNSNGVFASFANGSCHNGICWGLLLWLAKFIKIHFLPHLESFMWERKFEKKISKKILYNPLMGCSLFANSRFQMGVTVMGFAEHFGPCQIKNGFQSILHLISKNHILPILIFCCFVSEKVIYASSTEDQVFFGFDFFWNIHFFHTFHHF